MLIRRELLAPRRPSTGCASSDDLVDEAIKKGYFFLGGQQIAGPDLRRDEDGSTIWNCKRSRAGSASSTSRSGSYRDEQARSMQAAMMGEHPARLGPACRATRRSPTYLFERHHGRVRRRRRSRPTAYRDAMQLTDADVDALPHDARGRGRRRSYKADERTYKAIKPRSSCANLHREGRRAEARRRSPTKKDDKKDEQEGRRRRPAA